MTEVDTCPRCGASLPGRDGPAGPAAPEGDSEPSPIPLLASGSDDDDFSSSSFGPKLAAAEPDPILGEFVGPSSAENPLPPEAAPFGTGLDESPPAFPALRFDRPSSATSSPKSGQPEGEAELDDRDHAPGRPMGTVLLASYASAITLALAWTLTHRPSAEVDRPASATEARPVVGHQVGLSEVVPKPEPILAEHQATLQSPLKVGALEVTPLDVRRESVTLQRKSLTGNLERRDGGKNALVLRLRLRNVSDDAAFAPLDQAYLREQAPEVSESYLEAPDGGRIYPYPLAVESEWSIAGQDFDRLRPGESRVVAIVSAPDQPATPPGPLTWRIRLRTGIDRTDILGIREPAKPAPASP